LQSTKTIEDLSVHITNYLCFSVNASARAQISVANAQKVYADLDPAFHFDAYPDPAYHFDADPDPDPTFNMMQIQIRESVSSGLKTLRGFTVSLHISQPLTLMRIRIWRPFLCLSGSGFPY
jgi:hypothetical protein